jgi:hypothetical protein
MSEAQKVSFIVGGVQKGGTTALFRYLEDIPSLAMSTVKETHFFDDETGVDWTDPDYGRYHALFPPADGRPRGEATPIYIYWPNCLERIARYNPDIKLILLFRDPVQRAWSQWKMEYARDWETLPFEQAIREGRARVDSPENPGFHRVFSYVERGFYAEQLARVYALFPREQVLLIRSEELDARPNAVLRRICDFVGAAPPEGRVARRRELVARDIDYPSTLTAADVAYLRGLYAKDLAAFSALSGLKVDRWAKDGPKDKRNRVLEGLALDGLGLEIGGGYGPLAAGDPDLNVRTLDHLDQGALQAKFALEQVDPSVVQPVDYVWSGERYRDLVGETRFDWIVASHVIEHVPDLIGFINECAEILTDDGVLSLVVPDKRRSFDLYRPASGLGAVIDTHLQGRRASSPGQAAEFALNIAKLDGRDVWTDQDRGTPVFEHEAWRARELMEEAASGAYVDIHAWVFTPSSFRLLIEDLYALGLIGLRELRFRGGGDHEFLIQLGSHGGGPEVDRATLARRAQAERPETLDPVVDVAALKAHNLELRRALDEVLASTSWKITAPVRRLLRRFGQSR